MFYCLSHWCVEKTEMWTLPSFVFPPTHPVSREYLEWWKGLGSSRPFHCSGWSRKKGWLAEARPSITDQQVRYRQRGMYHPNDENSDTGLGSKGKIYKKGPFPDLPTITRNRKSTREVHFRYASDAESTREIHVQRVRSMYNAWDACTPRAKTRENQHLTRNNASGACISRGTYAWDTSHWSIPAKHTCISRVITRGMNATKL